MNHYSAKLLFQWLPIRSGKTRKRRVCEKRIVTFTAETPEAALQKAKDIGSSEEYVEEKSDGKVCFEFIGVLELMDVSMNIEEGEVWSELVEMIEPEKRINKIIPDEESLHALRQPPNCRGRLKYY